MSNHTYRVIDIVGASPDGGRRRHLQRSDPSGAHHARPDWFELQSVRGHLVDGPVGCYTVTMKVGFHLEDS
jgi:flavin-binding protein dodecin